MLKVGILLDRRSQEHWVVAALTRVAKLADVRLATVAIARRHRHVGPADLLHHGIDTVDHVVRCRREPLFRRRNIMRCLDVPELRLPGGSREADWMLGSEACRTLREADVDLWLCASRYPPTLADSRICRLGVWGIEIGCGVAAAHPWAGALEVADGSPVTAITVRDYASGGAGRVLLQSIAATELHSARRNRLNAVRKASWFFERLLLNIDAPHANTPQPAFPDGYPQGRRPTLTLTLRLAFSLLRRIAHNQLRTLRWRAQWQIAYCFGPERVQSIDVGKLRYLLPPADRFWADPMPIQHEGRNFIFFEEFCFSDWKGRLTAIEVFPDRAPGQPVVVLERPYHLSYPFLFRWQGDLYLLPESAEGGRIELYRCERFPDKWKFDRVLIGDVAAYDATLWQNDDRWWMFVSIALPGTADGDELHLYHATAPIGPWTPHPRNPVMSDARFSRPAGPMYRADGKLYRPSQDCSRTYGFAVWINRVDVLDDESYSETPVAEISPDMRDDFLCIHTIGDAGSLHVLDYQVLRKKR